MQHDTQIQKMRGLLGTFQHSDLRKESGWSLWVTRQPKNIREFLGHCAYSYESIRDTIQLVITPKGWDLFNDSMTQTIIRNLFAFYDARLEALIETSPEARTMIEARCSHLMETVPETGSQADSFTLLMCRMLTPPHFAFEEAPNSVGAQCH